MRRAGAMIARFAAQRHKLRKIENLNHRFRYGPRNDPVLRIISKTCKRRINRARISQKTSRCCKFHTCKPNAFRERASSHSKKRILCNARGQVDERARIAVHRAATSAQKSEGFCALGKPEEGAILWGVPQH
jgi:hypothetical protein